MNEYIYEIWTRGIFTGEYKFLAADVVIAKDCIEAMKEANRKGERITNHYQIKNFRKL